MDPNVSNEHTDLPAIDQPTKIIDLNDDCLVNIFKRLDHRSLLNLAVANEYLRPAARDVFHRWFISRYGLTDVVFDTEYAQLYPGRTYRRYPSIERIHRLKTYLQYMRCFGSSIGDMSICYRTLNKDQCDGIDQYLNKYCAENLVNISIIGRTSDFVHNFFERPFVNVQSVTIFDSCLGKKFVLFPQWFPNLQKLKLRNVIMDDRSIEMPLQHLQHLYIEINNRTLPYGFAKKEARHLLSLCPLLSSLEIYMSGDHGMTIITLLGFIKRNPLITKLILRMKRFGSDVSRNEVKKLTDEHPILIEVGLRNYRFTADTAMALIRGLDGLKHIELQMTKTTEYDRLVSELGNQWNTSIVGISKPKYHVVTAHKNFQWQ